MKVEEDCGKGLEYCKLMTQFGRVGMGGGCEGVRVNGE